MRKILFSLMIIGITCAMLSAGTMSYFGVSEIRVGNSFTAGLIDLKIDCNKSTHMQQWPCGGTYNVEQPIIFDEKDLVQGDKIFNWNDIKPGDFGEATISAHVYSNKAWFWMRIANPYEGPGITSEPEPTPDYGELAQNMKTRIWLDQGVHPGFGNDPKQYTGPSDGFESPTCNGGEGDNIWQQQYEPLIYPTEGTEGTMSDLIYNHNVLFCGIPIEACTVYYYGWAWWVPNDVGNVIQGDVLTFDIEFYAQQWRNNPNPSSPWPV